ncbi:iron complex transport system ATP-binding protein [Faunimonas pinastri]|uniref:Iron complex transport system ATP-binding protein n=1 Tax=Faunimonas pinastri TaxID=1855383 RepID=A0A1H9LZS9_9HYPH|nr:heme ABC transporter ATP-binding protein [Faunimonas pinastri]SER16829.1 iron complex transport system ATP-binding protein [Faunimonas pinastri]
MIRAEGLSVALSGRKVLENIDLQLRAGELCIVIGPNGAGKSTLLKALTGTLAPATGRVLFDGRDLADWPRRQLAQRRAVLAQSTEVGFPFTVYEVVSLGLTVADTLQPEERRRIPLALLSRVGLDGCGGRLYRQLSGGEQQRVQIARILAQLECGGSPASERWLFLDEPTASVDIRHQFTILDIARDHARQGGGALAILHDLNIAALYADRLVVLSGGRIVGEGAPVDIMTEGLIESAFGVRLQVQLHGGTGRPAVLPHARR